MTKEIKFRAWDKFGHPKQEICEVIEIDFKEQKVLLRSKNKQEFWRLFKDVALMQFTGLKDKNGKEIFEGDIIFMSCWEERKHYEDAKKRDCEGIFLVVSKLTSWGYDFSFESISGYPTSTHLFGNKNNIKIIGNKFENPELLGDVKC